MITTHWFHWVAISPPRSRIGTPVLDSVSFVLGTLEQHSTCRLNIIFHPTQLNRIRVNWSWCYVVQTQSLYRYYSIMWILMQTHSRINNVIINSDLHLIYRLRQLQYWAAMLSSCSSLQLYSYSHCKSAWAGCYIPRVVTFRRNLLTDMID